MTETGFSPTQASPLEWQRLVALFRALARIFSWQTFNTVGYTFCIRLAYGLAASIAPDIASAALLQFNFAWFREKGSRVKVEPTKERNTRTSSVCARASALAAGKWARKEPLGANVAVVNASVAQEAAPLQWQQSFTRVTDVHVHRCLLYGTVRNVPGSLVYRHQRLTGLRNPPDAPMIAQNNYTMKFI